MIHWLKSAIKSNWPLLTDKYTDIDMKKPEILRCAFCNKKSNEVRKLIAGDNVHICDECVELCNDILREEGLKPEGASTPSRKQLKRELTDFASPQQVYDQLSSLVIGQDNAKKVLSVAIYRHYKRIIGSVVGKAQLEKDNILIIGPTGSGKTLLARTLAHLLKVPFSISDATAFTEAGYVGEDVELALTYLIKAADDDMSWAEKGIVYLDEIDKVARKNANPSITRDVSGEGVQQALLNMMGGGKIRVDPTNKRKHPMTDLVEIDTKDILFICGGSFEGIEQLVAMRLGTFPERGFSIKDRIIDQRLIDDLRSQITQEDLIAFGFLPEFAARFTNIVTLSALTEAELLRVLTELPNSILGQYISFFQAEGVELTFKDDALDSIVRAAIQERIGARGLRYVLERSLLDTMFYVPGRKEIKRCIIEKDTIDKEKAPLLLTETGKSVAIKRKQVFISYSRKDVEWLQELKVFLTPLLKNKTIDIWFDGAIKPSQEWRKEIEQAMASAKVAVLLVSPNFLASDYAMNEEVPYFLKLAETKEVKIVWILIGACLYTETPIINYQAAHDISTPLEQLGKSHRGEAWTNICTQIKLAASSES